MTEIPALYKITADTEAAFAAADKVYPLGAPTFITSGTSAGRMKIGDGVHPWTQRPLFPPPASETVPGLIKSSSVRLFLRVNANGQAEINGLETALLEIHDKDEGQDALIAEIQTRLAGMSGTIIYIGSVDEYTSDLKAMDDADRYALLTARAVEIRGQAMDGYTLQDLGIEEEPGRFNYWQYQHDGTWFDLGERGEVSQATDSDLGIVMGSGAAYKIHVGPDGTMSVNGLAEKLDALDAKDEELGEAIEDVAGRESSFAEAQAEINAGVAESISGIMQDAASTRSDFDGFKTAQEQNNAEQSLAIGNAANKAEAAAQAVITESERAQNAEAGLVSKDIFDDTNGALVADMAVAPEAGGIAVITKTLKNVGNGENFDMNVHIKSEKGTIKGEFSQQDEHNYTLNIEAVLTENDTVVRELLLASALYGARVTRNEHSFFGYRVRATRRGRVRGVYRDE